MKLGIILETKEHEKSWNAIRFGVAARSRGHEVKIFLMGEAVEIEDIEDTKFDVSSELDKFVEAGGELLACGTCLKSRQMEEMETCVFSTMIDCVKLVEWSDKVITF